MTFRPIQYLLIAPIRMYQMVLSPVVGRYRQCRFHPTCSQYAVEAIQKYGAVVGTAKVVHRLKRCRPDSLETCIDPP